MQKKIIVIGAGPAGIRLAMRLKEDGFEPLLIEKSAKVGGQWEQYSSHDPLLSWTNHENNVSKEALERFGVVVLTDAHLVQLTEEQDGWVVDLSVRGTPIRQFFHAVAVCAGSKENNFHALGQNSLLKASYIPHLGKKVFFEPITQHQKGHFVGQKVVLIGSGNRAAETALKIHGVIEEPLLWLRNNYQYKADNHKIEKVRREYGGGLIERVESLQEAYWEATQWRIVIGKGKDIQELFVDSIIYQIGRSGALDVIIKAFPLEHEKALRENQGLENKVKTLEHQVVSVPRVWFAGEAREGVQPGIAHALSDAESCAKAMISYLKK